MPCQCSLTCGNAGAQGPGKISVTTKRCGKKVGEDELDKSNERDQKDGKIILIIPPPLFGFSSKDHGR